MPTKTVILLLPGHVDPVSRVISPQGQPEPIRKGEETVATFSAVEYEGFTQDRLEDAFNRVADSADWRNPISAMIDACEIEEVRAAIEFYVGEAPEFQPYDDDGEFVRVTSRGYRLGPCGP